MLYKLGSTEGKFDTLEPVAFRDFASFKNVEKDLEDLIAKSILDVLYEESSLMPVFQEQKGKAEADIYALDERGELVIFELKRGTTGEDAVQQALRYAQSAGQWSYETLQKKYREYKGNRMYADGDEIELRKAHKEAFGLKQQLDVEDINNRQRLIVIGSAADDSLINAADYWKKQGILIDFLPYRIYELNNEKYFEFFALPYDKHRNPNSIKGVLFDTNKTYNKESIWEMIEHSRVAAWGTTKHFVGYIHPDDFIFLSHRGTGIVAAGRVKGGNIEKSEEKDMWFRQVEFTTPIPVRGPKICAMDFRKVSEITGKSFFWARTIKVPYLTREEAENLETELIAHLSNS